MLENLRWYFGGQNWSPLNWQVDVICERIKCINNRANSSTCQNIASNSGVRVKTGKHVHDGTYNLYGRATSTTLSFFIISVYFRSWTTKYSLFWSFSRKQWRKIEIFASETPKFWNSTRGEHFGEGEERHKVRTKKNRFWLRVANSRYVLKNVRDWISVQKRRILIGEFFALFVNRVKM